MRGKIRTVLGDIDPPNGSILIHEHLRINLSHNKGPQTVLGPEDNDDVIADLRATREMHGLSLIAEMTVPGSGRNVAALKQMSERSGVAVVASTGFYWEPVPAGVDTLDVTAMQAAMTRDIEVGAENTDIRCGVIKVGTDKGTPPEVVERIFQAAARSSRETGVAIITHTSTPDQAQWQIDTLERAGADLSRVLISHLHNLTSFQALRQYARRGVRFGFDQIGFAKGLTFEQYVALVTRGRDSGLAPQTLISSDVARRARLMRHGGESYATVFLQIAPRLRQLGYGAPELAGLLHDNPARLLAMT